MEILLGVTVAVVVCAVLKWIWDRYTVFGFFKRIGIPGPSPTSIFLGNEIDILKHGRVPKFKEWTEKYGKTFGYFESKQPVLVVSDLSHVREILIKQFDKFNERRLFFDVSHYECASSFDLSGNRWKKVRSISTPTFSAKNMKLMSPLVHDSIDKLMGSLKKHCEKKDPRGFEISTEFYKMTLDSIASVVFSYDADPFLNKDSPFIKHLNTAFAELNPKTMSLHKKLLVLVCLVFPSLQAFFEMIYPNSKEYIGPKRSWFLQLAKKMIEERLESREMRNDYIQLMLKYSNRDGSGFGSGTDTEGSDNEMEQEKKSFAKGKSLTMEEMQGQCFEFLTAGYETTATTLAYAMHYLSVCQEKQEKLYQEIEEYFTPEGRKVNYETVQNLPYLDMVFQEVSRLSGIARVAVTRLCNQATQVGDLNIPKGTKVYINIGDIHDNIDYWGPEPVKEFVPERFTPERKGARDSMAYLPFGAGPKSCVGLRFGIMQAKMTIVNILKAYSVLPCDQTQNPLKLTQDGVIGPADGVYVRLEERY